MIVDIDLYSVL